MKIGVLTGGGDCPGLNAVIRAVVRKAHKLGSQVVGVRNGWQGLLENSYVDLDSRTASGILHLGGTIIGTSRTNPFKTPGGAEAVMKNFRLMGMEGLVVIGGEGTMGCANGFAELGLPVVGVPKTIDNDLFGTDYTFGFDTAVSIATEAIDRIHTTAEAHNRVMVVEVMGRHVGWIAMHAGLAGGADLTLIPEKPVDLEEVCDAIRRRHARGKSFSVVVVAEGVEFAEGSGIEAPRGEVDEFGHVRLGGVSQLLAREIERRTGFETRCVVLGHTQRGGTPTAHDRVLATRYGVFAAGMAHRGEFGKMAALRGNEIVAIPLAEVAGKLKRVDMAFYELASTFFG
jgi:6-phosphofructokinase 1